MAIESYRAGQIQVAVEKRSELFPGMKILIGLLRKAARLEEFELPQFAELSLDAIQENSKENLAYLFECLVQDVERIDTRVEAFEQATNEERNAMNQLVSEAVARAFEAKSKDRVKRIARILANAFRAGPKQNYEMERELIDAATQIADRDAFILGVMMRHQGKMVKGAGLADVNVASDTWAEMRREHNEFRDHHIHVSCARLQSQGLIIRMDRKTTALDLATNAYSLTTFGVQFCEWCLQIAAE
jgi:hypothetical protein